MNVGEVNVKVSLEPWLETLCAEFGGSLRKAVDAGLPEKVAVEEAEKFIAAITPHGTKVN